MNEKKTLVSIVAQCYNEEEMLPVYYQAMCNIMDTVSDTEFELIIVDDCSKDNSTLLIKRFAETDPRVKGLLMSRNFGKAQCCIAGLSHASGDYIITMDMDMQDPPALIPQMLTAIHDRDVDIIATRATTRKGYSLVHKLLVRAFYGLFNRICTIQLVDGQRDFRLMKRSVVDAILLHGEYNLFDKGYFSDVGYRTEWIEYENTERAAGETKWHLKRLLKYSLTGIIGYSLTPINAICYLAAFFSVICFVSLLALLVGFIVSGLFYQYLIILTAIAFVISLQLWPLAILGLYIAQIHTEVKHRPRWIVRQYVNLNDKDIVNDKNICP